MHVLKPSFALPCVFDLCLCAAATRAHTQDAITLAPDAQPVLDQVEVFERISSFVLQMLHWHPLSLHTMVSTAKIDKAMAMLATKLAGEAAAFSVTKPLGRVTMDAAAQIKHMDDDSLSVPLWPTPSLAAWSEIQTIAGRALIALQWCTIFASSDKHQPEYAGLTFAEASNVHICLVAVVHEAVSGHMLDPKLDVSKLFWTAFAPVMQCYLSFGCRILAQCSFGLALLRRMATDKDMVAHCGTDETKCECGGMNKKWLTLLANVLWCKSYSLSLSAFVRSVAVSLHCNQLVHIKSP